MNQLRERIIPVRVSYSEYQKIIDNAKRADKKVSTYMRTVALGTVIKEKPDSRFYECLKDLRYIRMGLKSIANLTYTTQKLDVLKFQKEIEKIDKFILEIKQHYVYFDKSEKLFELLRLIINPI